MGDLAQQIKKIEANQKIIWGHMLELMQTRLIAYDRISELEQRLAELEAENV